MDPIGLISGAPLSSEMNERLYPRDSPTDSGEYSNAKSPSPSPPVSGHHYERNMSQDSFMSSKMSYPGYGCGYGYGPNPGTYVIQVPKDQIYRVPPPENAHKYKIYTEKNGEKALWSIMCPVLSIILIITALIAVAGVLLSIFDNPIALNYSIESVHVKGVNLSTMDTTSTMAPVLNITWKTQNNNGKIRIYNERGSEIKIYHDGVNLCNGKLPEFDQTPKSVTVFSTALGGPGIVMSKPARDKLVTEQKRGKVPLDIVVNIPVKMEIRAVSTWRMTVDVWCDVTVNALTVDAKVVSKNCNVNAVPW